MKSKANQSQGMLLFKLTLTQRFAIGTLKVREIVPFQALTSIPYSHHHVLGTATIRDMAIPIIDMSAAVGFRALHQDEFKDCYIIITDCMRTVVGFAVRAIDKIIECDWKAIESSPKTAGSNVFVTGITRVEDNIVQLLDVELLLSKIYPEDTSNLYPILSDVEREKLKPLNILLVDDSFVARKQLSTALDSINIPYQVAINGLDAYEMLKKASDEGNPYNIVVSDIEMPGLDGYELAFEIQNDARLKDAYVILHTSLSSEICVEQAHQVGAHEALTKFEATELVQAMLRGANHNNRQVA
ncbi:MULTISPECIES: chemotaxis protein [Aliivibrio]|uniref:Chemotaxis protein CheV n=1 Tax=Aliivibrio finisterrensis TaxID=511998 RepID=A0A4V1Z892_9GAMM|nr:MULTISPECIES: chemotaxis protein [Aliivibrio]MDD9174050.1 chemotaxis protein [Aliivibrio sp. S3TY1]MDD9180003.1 chemotaxis protein [Aliivibrio sp. A6]MDD9191127.1 chemotaxis protein [Aliivibrio sp. S2TY2]RYU48167.1 chemotaxis protein CheV [Aliivibrio finisterrensis]RYU49782.1 chemotaxis protein CheV [Aliivibrio finisterrensis]